MNKLGTALLSASVLLVAGTASAAQPQWTYGDIGYYQADSYGDQQTDAFTLNASLGFLDVWHIQAGYMDGSLGEGDFNNDYDGWSVTVGAHPAITDSSQLVVNAVYFDTSYDVDSSLQDVLGNNINRDGWGFGVGVRSAITDKVEASAMAYWTYAQFDGDNDSDFNAGDNADATNISVALGGRYNWTRNFSTGATAIIGDPITGAFGSASNSMNLDVRWTFDGFSL